MISVRPSWSLAPGKGGDLQARRHGAEQAAKPFGYPVARAVADQHRTNHPPDGRCLPPQQYRRNATEFKAKNVWRSESAPASLPDRIARDAFAEAFESYSDARRIQPDASSEIGFW
jgi:hypothetical protein